MTPTQHYFPYFFELDSFNKAIKQFGLSSYPTYNNKTKMADELILTKYKFFELLGSRPKLFAIPFGATLMIQNDNLLYWTTDQDSLDITQIKLTTLIDSPEIENHKIDLLRFSVGHNRNDTGLNLTDFVTYVRKDGLTYTQDYYERFALIFINKDDLNIVPFDWFNKTGGDYGYVWPATAKLDKDNCKLYGRGMRMADFAVDIDKACL